MSTQFARCGSHSFGNIRCFYIGSGGGKGEGSSCCALRTTEPDVRGKTFVTNSQLRSVRSLFSTSLFNTPWEGSTSLPLPSWMFPRSAEYMAIDLNIQ